MEKLEEAIKSIPNLFGIDVSNMLQVMEFRDYLHKNTKKLKDAFDAFKKQLQDLIKNRPSENDQFIVGDKEALVDGEVVYKTPLVDLWCEMIERLLLGKEKP